MSIGIQDVSLECAMCVQYVAKHGPAQALRLFTYKTDNRPGPVSNGVAVRLPQGYKTDCENKLHSNSMHITTHLLISDQHVRQLDFALDGQAVTGEQLVQPGVRLGQDRGGRTAGRDYVFLVIIAK